VSEVVPLALAASGAVAAVAVRLRTGRTHQIRVHLQQAKHPLLGDPVYGEARWRSLSPAYRTVARDFPRPALHAWVLVVRHPADGMVRRFEAPLPADLLALWTGLDGDVARLVPPEVDGL
jgi:23S rRNA pseudouridine1911/1915/1917 synthase